MVANTVLIVDDCSFIRVGLRFILESKGYRVLEAATDLQAVRLFEQENPGVAILDISLDIGPDGKEGLALAQQFKAAAPNMGIVLLSGSLSHYQEFLEISRKHRGIGYIYKGNYKKEEILAVIDMVCKGGVWVAPEIANHQETSVALPLSTAEQAAVKTIVEQYHELSERELDIVKLVAESCDNKEIACRLNISLNTVSAHMSHIYAKLGLEEDRGKVEKRALLAKAYWSIKK